MCHGHGVWGVWSDIVWCIVFGVCTFCLWCVLNMGMICVHVCFISVCVCMWYVVFCVVYALSGVYIYSECSCYLCRIVCRVWYV